MGAHPVSERAAERFHRGLAWLYAWELVGALALVALTPFGIWFHHTASKQHKHDADAEENDV